MGYLTTLHVSSGANFYRYFDNDSGVAGNLPWRFHVGKYYTVLATSKIMATSTWI